MVNNSQVLVIGAGVSGLCTAIHLAEAGLKVLVAAKAPWQVSNSYLAQGGIAAALGFDDDPSRHAKDTMTVTRGLARPDRVHILTHSAPQAVSRFIEDGVVALTPDGRVDLAQEAGHDRARIVHSPDGMTGRAITANLIQKAQSLSTIAWTEARVIGLGTDGDRVIGAFIATGRDTLEFLSARAVVLATGGMAGLYALSSNPVETSGDGLMLAYQAGATLADLEFMQFHPTILRGGEKRPGLLLSEALRGAGAHLIDARGNRIMADHPAAELAPRDVVAQAVFTHQPVYLSMAHLPASRIHAHFSGIVEALARWGWDLTRDRIPVSAGAHFAMGGVVTDASGRTDTKGLYAVGEVAMVGVHGANRLASNSLLEGLVYAKRAAQAIVDEEYRGRWDQPRASSWVKDRDFWTVPAGLPEAMDRCLGVIRDGDSLEKFAEYLTSLPESAATRLAMMATDSARLRQESRGAHVRRDFPDNDSRYRGHFLHRQGRSPWFEALDADQEHPLLAVSAERSGHALYRTEEVTR